MGLIGVTCTCLPAECWFSELSLWKSNWACWFRTKRTLFCWKLNCSRHYILWVILETENSIYLPTQCKYKGSTCGTEKFPRLWIFQMELMSTTFRIKFSCFLNNIFSLVVYSGFQHILCCVFVLLVFVLCTPCCQFLWIVLFGFPVRYSLTFIN